MLITMNEAKQMILILHKTTENNQAQFILVLHVRDNRRANIWEKANEKVCVYFSLSK